MSTPLLWEPTTPTVQRLAAPLEEAAGTLRMVGPVRDQSGWSRGHVGWSGFVQAFNASGVGIPALVKVSYRHATYPDGCSAGERLEEPELGLLVSAQGQLYGFGCPELSFIVASLSADPADVVASVSYVFRPVDAPGMSVLPRTALARQGITVQLGAVSLATAQKFIVPQRAHSLSLLTVAPDALSLAFFQGVTAVGQQDLLRAVSDPQNLGPWGPLPVPGGSSLGLFYSGAPPGAPVDVVATFQVST